MRRPIRWRKTFLLLARLAFGALFLWAAFSKIVSPERFAQQISDYGIIGPTASALVGTVLPWAEFLIGSCLLAGVWDSGAWLATIALCGCFIFARATILHRGLSIECGCGIVNEKVTPASSLMVIGLFVASTIAYVASIRVRPALGQSAAPTKSASTASELTRVDLNAGVSPCI